jgi:hypothetical protein
MEGDQWHGNKAENYRYIKSLIRRDFILSFSANKPVKHVMQKARAPYINRWILERRIDANTIQG